MEIPHFDMPWGIHTYLLEKVRVIRQQEAPRLGGHNLAGVHMNPFP